MTDDAARQRMDQFRASQNRPRECHCTGACGGNPANCPNLNSPPQTFDQYAATVGIFAGPDAEAALRALYAEENR